MTSAAMRAHASSDSILICSMSQASDKSKSSVLNGTVKMYATAHSGTPFSRKSVDASGCICIGARNIQNFKKKHAQQLKRRKETCTYPSE
jgi:hypothetical protein